MQDRARPTAFETLSPEAETLKQVFQERAKRLSEVPDKEEAGDQLSLLSFMLGEELYGVELKYLVETRQSVTFRRVPSAPPHVAGITNLRGELLAVADFCPILGLPRRDWTQSSSALLVLASRGNSFALLVDRALDILSFPLNQLQPSPVTLEAEEKSFAQGILLLEDWPLTLIDMESIFLDSRISGITGQLI